MAKPILYFLLSAATVALLAACQSSAPTTQGVEAAGVPLEYLPALKGDYFEFQSAAVGRSFHIYVAYPESYEKDLRARYPVVYLLDGDSLFPIHATYHRFLNYDEGIPEAIIVGIAYGSFDPSINKRSYDFSAPAHDASREQGGSPAFHRFLKTELIPEIDRRYRSAPDRRVLFGQSRGGYMVLYSAFTDPDLFWGRIASNPAFDPGKQMFYSTPSLSTKRDLGLVVASSERDRPELRRKALEWFQIWNSRSETPWQVKTLTIPGGTHAADITNIYRAGMLWLFRRTPVQAEQ